MCFKGTMSLLPASTRDRSQRNLLAIDPGLFSFAPCQARHYRWAQVNGYRGETKTLQDIEARVQHDIFYVDNWSPLLDLKILIRTVLICLSRRNAY